MNCLKCGTTIPESSLYCPNCGTPVQMVPDYQSLEGVLSDEVNNLIGDKKASRNASPGRTGNYDTNGTYYNQNRHGREGHYDSRERLYDSRERLYNNREKLYDSREKLYDNHERIYDSRERLYEDREEYDRDRLKYEREYRERKRLEQEKLRKKRIIIIAAAAVVVIIAVIILISSLGKNSYNSQMHKGEKALKNEKYEDAINAFYKASELNKEKADPYIGMGKCYIGIEDITSAEGAFEKAVEIAPEDPDAYMNLAEFYCEQGDKEAVTLLFEGVTDKNILEKCSDYIAEVPVISPGSGEYSDTVNVSISSSDGTVRYTMDGTYPNENSPQYTEPIILNETNNYTIIAVSINAKGIASSEARAEFDLNIPNPDGPTVNPSAGTYTEPTQITVNVPADSNVYYTLDGTEPTENSYKYNGPVDMPEGQSTFSCIAINSKGKKSSVIKRQYNLLVLK